METHNYIKTPDHVVVAQGDAEYQMILDNRNKTKEFNAFRMDIQSCITGLAELKDLISRQHIAFDKRLLTLEGQHA